MKQSTKEDLITVAKWFGFTLAAAGILLFITVAISDYYKRTVIEPREKARQAEIDQFYWSNHCRPLGYVATKYHPVRTYQCDTGVFIVEDMR